MEGEGRFYKTEDQGVVSIVALFSSRKLTGVIPRAIIEMKTPFTLLIQLLKTLLIVKDFI